MICVDNNFLVLLIKPDSDPPDDPNTGRPVERVPERIELLKKTWNDTGEVILIPDPVLSEFMMLSDVDKDRVFHLDRFKNSPNYEIKPFDTRAAIELAIMYIKEKGSLSKTKAKAFEKTADTKTRLSFDRQIVAVAKVHEVTAIYSNDKGVRAFCETHNMPSIGIYELPLPADDPKPEPEPEPTLFDNLPVEEINDESETIKPSATDIRGSIKSDVEDQARAASAESENEVSNKDNEN